MRPTTNNLSVAQASCELETRVLLAADSYEDYNIAPVNYNPDYPGAGRTGTTNYNKVQLPDVNQEIVSDSFLYDGQGGVIVDDDGEAVMAEAGPVGYYDEYRFGGLNAGGLTSIDIDGETFDVAYVHAAETTDNGTQSGYIKVSQLSPEADIVSALEEVQGSIDELMPSREGREYTATTIEDGGLPDYAAEYYVVPDRDESYSAGKAKYYYARDGLLDVLINIPETGSQRYGVSTDQQPIGETFWVDNNVESYTVPVYAPSSSEVDEEASFDLLYGYSETSSGERRYGWANAENLSFDGTDESPEDDGGYDAESAPARETYDSENFTRHGFDDGTPGPFTELNTRNSEYSDGKFISKFNPEGFIGRASQRGTQLDSNVWFENVGVTGFNVMIPSSYPDDQIVRIHDFHNTTAEGEELWSQVLEMRGSDLWVRFSGDGINFEDILIAENVERDVFHEIKMRMDTGGDGTGATTIVLNEEIILSQDGVDIGTGSGLYTSRIGLRNYQNTDAPLEIVYDNFGTIDGDTTNRQSAWDAVDPDLSN